MNSRPDIKILMEAIKERMEKGEITPEEGAKQILSVTQSALDPTNVHEITIPMKAALYAMGKEDIADSLVAVHVRLLPNYGIAVMFGVVPGSPWAPKAGESYGRVEDVGDDDNDFVFQATMHTMRAFGFSMHRHEDGSLHLDGHPDMTHDIDAQVAAFAAEIPDHLEPPKPPGEVMGKWG